MRDEMSPLGLGLIWGGLFACCVLFWAVVAAWVLL